MAEKIFGSSLRSQVFAFLISPACVETRTQVGQAPTILKPRWRRPCRFWHPTGPKWFEPSDRLFHPQGRQGSQLRAKGKGKKKCTNIWFTLWLDIGVENITTKWFKNKKKQTSTNRSMWTGFLKVALFWMVLLPLPCDHHLSVSCSALENACESGRHFQHLPPGGAAELFHTLLPPRPPRTRPSCRVFSELSSKCLLQAL